MVIFTENSRSAYFTYAASGERVKMRLTNPTGTGTVLSRYYIGDCYEFDQKRGSSTTEERDYLGSITLVATADGTLVAEYSYDPWGFPTSRRTTTATPTALTIR